MTNNILQKIAGVTAGAIVGLGAIAPHSAEAALITYDFRIPISFENYEPGEVNGRFTYDDTTEVRSESIGWIGETIVERKYDIHSIDFLFNGKTYTEEDALSPITWSIFNNYGDEAVLRWNTEDFLFSLGSYRTIEIWTNFEIKTNGQKEFVSVVDFSRVEEEAPTTVPEPSAIGGLMVLGLGCLVRKKVRRYA